MRIFAHFLDSRRAIFPKATPKPGPLSPAELEQSALRLLTLRDHSRAELRRKLQARNELEESQLEAVLDRLERLDYLNDPRYTRHYTESRCRRGFGPLRIRQELQQRGIAPALVEQVLGDHAESWREALHKLAAAKYGNAPAGDLKEQARRARFLQSRGFSTAMIRDYLFAEP